MRCYTKSGNNLILHCIAMNIRPAPTAIRMEPRLALHALFIVPHIAKIKLSRLFALRLDLVRHNRHLAIDKLFHRPFATIFTRYLYTHTDPQIVNPKSSFINLNVFPPNHDPPSFDPSQIDPTQTARSTPASCPLRSTRPSSRHPRG